MRLGAPERDNSIPVRAIESPVASLLEPGYCIDRYELLAKIGQGGMASVWLARANDSARDVADEQGTFVAIKTILPRHASDDQLKKMMLDEARIAMAIDHPNVARDLHNLSLFLIAASRLGDAKPMLRRACLILMQASGMADPNTGACLTNYGRLLQAMGYGPDQIRAALRRITGSSRSGNEGKS